MEQRSRWLQRLNSGLKRSQVRWLVLAACLLGLLFVFVKVHNTNSSPSPVSITSTLLETKATTPQPLPNTTTPPPNTTTKAETKHHRNFAPHLSDLLRERTKVIIDKTIAASESPGSLNAADTTSDSLLLDTVVRVGMRRRHRRSSSGQRRRSTKSGTRKRTRGSRGKSKRGERRAGSSSSSSSSSSSRVRINAALEHVEYEPGFTVMFNSTFRYAPDAASYFPPYSKLPTNLFRYINDPTSVHKEFSTSPPPLTSPARPATSTSTSTSTLSLSLPQSPAFLAPGDITEGFDSIYTSSLGPVAVTPTTNATSSSSPKQSSDGKESDVAEKEKAKAKSREDETKPATDAWTTVRPRIALLVPLTSRNKTAPATAGARDASGAPGGVGEAGDSRRRRREELEARVKAIEALPLWKHLYASFCELTYDAMTDDFEGHEARFTPLYSFYFGVDDDDALLADPASWEMIYSRMLSVLKVDYAVVKPEDHVSVVVFKSKGTSGSPSWVVDRMARAACLSPEEAAQASSFSEARSKRRVTQLQSLVSRVQALVPGLYSQQQRFHNYLHEQDRLAEREENGHAEANRLHLPPSSADVPEDILTSRWHEWTEWRGAKADFLFQINDDVTFASSVASGWAKKLIRQVEMVDTYEAAKAAAKAAVKAAAEAAANAAKTATKDVALASATVPTTPGKAAAAAAVTPTATVASVATAADKRNVGDSKSLPPPPPPPPPSPVAAAAPAPVAAPPVAAPPLPEQTSYLPFFYFGLSGPVDVNMSRIFTQAFVPCSHVAIFGSFFHPTFQNWYSDDALSVVYGPQFTRSSTNVTVVHHVDSVGRRYVVHRARNKVKEAVVEDKKWLQMWLKVHGVTHHTIPDAFSVSLTNNVG